MTQANTKNYMPDYDDVNNDKKDNYDNKSSYDDEFFQHQVKKMKSSMTTKYPASSSEMMRNYVVVSNESMLNSIPKF